MDGEAPEAKVKKMEFVDLSGFKLKEVLRNDTDHVRCVLHATDNEERSAVILLSKKPFSEETLSGVLIKESRSFLHAQNDIYGNYDIQLPPEFSIAKSTVIWPATEQHIEKYREQECHVITETAEDYRNITLPFIEETQFSIQWIYNLLDHKAETDRIIFEDPDPEIGFILAPDLKWDGKLMDTLYVTAIIHKHGIKSIRDLNESHIPLLNNVWKKSTETILKKYGVDPSQIKAYFHYQPSYYHLHVHFVHVMHDAPGGGAFGAHPLANVISNIERIPDFYQNAGLAFIRRLNDPLFKKFKEANRI